MKQPGLQLIPFRIPPRPPAHHHHVVIVQAFDQLGQFFGIDLMIGGKGHDDPPGSLLESRGDRDRFAEGPGMPYQSQFFTTVL